MIKESWKVLLIDIGDRIFINQMDPCFASNHLETEIAP